MLSQLTSADFTPYLHQTFQLNRNSETPLAVELISVQKVGAPTTPDNATCPHFSLVLRGSAYAYLPHQTYTLAHPQLGALALSLIPIGLDGAGIRYEATFH